MRNLTETQRILFLSLGNMPHNTPRVIDAHCVEIPKVQIEETDRAWFRRPITR